MRIDAARLTRTTRAFLRLTRGRTDASRVLRALGLHLLQGGAPAVFRRLRLGPALRRAVAALRTIPLSLPPHLDEDEAQTRVDAWYLRRRHGLAARMEGRAVERTALRLDDSAPLYAWALRCLWALGQGRAALPPPRVSHRLLRVYALTHEVLFATHYLHQAMARPPSTLLRRARAAAPWVAASGHVDAAAELALALQALGDPDTPACRALLEAVARAQLPDGRIRDDSLPLPEGELDDHATLVAMVAFARCEGRLG